MKKSYSLRGVPYSEVPYLGGWGRESLNSEVLWVWGGCMVTWDPPAPVKRQTDTTENVTLAL